MVKRGRREAEGRTKGGWTGDEGKPKGGRKGGGEEKGGRRGSEEKVKGR